MLYVQGLNSRPSLCKTCSQVLFLFLLFICLYLVGGDTQTVLGLAQGSVIRDSLLVDCGTIGCKRLKLCQVCERQVPFPLLFLGVFSSPLSFFFNISSGLIFANPRGFCR